MLWASKWITAKKEILKMRRNKTESLLKSNSNCEKMQNNDC